MYEYFHRLQFHFFCFLFLLQSSCQEWIGISSNRMKCYNVQKGADYYWNSRSYDLSLSLMICISWVLVDQSERQFSIFHPHCSITVYGIVNWDSVLLFCLLYFQSKSYVYTFIGSFFLSFSIFNLWSLSFFHIAVDGTYY